MKKNRMLKIASAMIMLCLITTCAIGTTFAKYTTANSASDTARVAKWGVEVSASGTMFGKAYGANGAGSFGDSIMAETSGSVNTASADKVVAPGTKNDTGIQIKLKGQPEVSFEFTATANPTQDIFLGINTYGVMVEAHGVNAATDFIEEGIYYLESSTYKPASLSYYLANTGATYYKLTDKVRVDAVYYPIVWTGAVVATATPGVGSGTQQFATLAAAVANLVDGINALPAYEANTNVDLTYTLTWAWAIENGANAAEKELANKCDTILGNIGHVTVVKLTGQDYVAIESTDYCLTVESGFSVTATQVD